MPPLSLGVFVNIPEIARSYMTWSGTHFEGNPAEIFFRFACCCFPWVGCEGARMNCFLGELIYLAALLIQRSCWNLKQLMTTGRIEPAWHESSYDFWVSSHGVCRPERAAQRLAIGPPGHRSTVWLSCFVRSLQPAMVRIPSRRSLRG